MQGSQLGPNDALYREVPLYRTASWVPMVSSIWVPVVPSIERFHCIQDSQLGPMVPSIERFHCIQDSQLGPMVPSIERFHCTSFCPTATSAASDNGVIPNHSGIFNVAMK